MLCELKQTVLLLEQEFTPVEIRIGWASARLGSLKQEYRCCSSGFIRNSLTTG